MTLQNYLADPCGSLSIPWWKNKGITIPPHMRIVHQRDFDESLLTLYRDEPYFRLKHDLKTIPPADARFLCRAAGEDDLPRMVEIINRSYADLAVTEEQLRGYRATAAFAEELWVIACDADGKPVGCGIADFDPEAHEGVLEWIQVLPEYRGRGGWTVHRQRIAAAHGSPGGFRDGFGQGQQYHSSGSAVPPLRLHRG